MTKYLSIKTEPMLRAIRARHTCFIDTCNDIGVKVEHIIWKRTNLHVIHFHEIDGLGFMTRSEAQKRTIISARYYQHATVRRPQKIRVYNRTKRTIIIMRDHHSRNRLFHQDWGQQMLNNPPVNSNDIYFNVNMYEICSDTNRRLAWFTLSHI